MQCNVQGPAATDRPAHPRATLQYSNANRTALVELLEAEYALYKQHVSYLDVTQAPTMFVQPTE